MGCKILLLTAFLVGASALALVDTMASARVRAKARLREALRSADDRASDPNVIAAVEQVAPRVNGWRNVLALHLKATNTVALPFYHSLPHAG